MIYSEGLSFNLVKIPLVRKAIDSIADYDKCFKPHHVIRLVTFLVKKVERMDKIELERYEE